MSTTERQGRCESRDAAMDWCSHFVLFRSLSTSLDADFCVPASEEALHVSKPPIFNTDQGPQFTSRSFAGALEHAGIQISMDGKGRAFGRQSYDHSSEP